MAPSWAWGGSDDELIRSLPFSVLAPQGVGHRWSNHPRTHKSVLEQEATGRSHTGSSGDVRPTGGQIRLLGEWEWIRSHLFLQDPSPFQVPEESCRSPRLGRGSPFLRFCPGGGAVLGLSALPIFPAAMSGCDPSWRAHTTRNQNRLRASSWAPRWPWSFLFLLNSCTPCPFRVRGPEKRVL